MNYCGAQAFIRSRLICSLCTLFITNTTYADDTNTQELMEYQSEISASWRDADINAGVVFKKQELNQSNEMALSTQKDSVPHDHINSVYHVHSYDDESIEGSSKSSYYFILIYLLALVGGAWLLMKKHGKPS